MVQTLCVCGAGTMGSGIAQSAAQQGIYTLLFDLNPQALEKAQQNINKNLQQLVDRKKMEEAEKASVISRIAYVSNINDCLADLVIEAIVEKPEIKVALFNMLAEVNHSETIFATNTSSLSVTQIAEQVRHPQRVIGMHFFNPATIMKLVEVVNTSFTNEQTTQMTVALAKQMGKTPVLCKDAPGFIVNHVARPYYLEALKLIESTQADSSAEALAKADFDTIDSLLEASGFKMGPFRLMDLIGNDINFAVSTEVYEALGRPERLKPSFIQKEKVEQGALGRKTGKGYYEY